MTPTNGFSQWFRRYCEQLRERGMEGLRLVVMTYNEVWDYPSGPVVHEQPRLSIDVVNGGGLAAFLAVLQDFDGEIVGTHPVEKDVAGVVHATKTAGAECVCAVASAIRTETKRGTLVLLYAGISRFSEMCDAADTLRSHGVDVALVTCGCEDRRHIRTIQELEKERVLIEAFCHSPRTVTCHGGRDVLRDMVRAAIAGWSPEAGEAARA